MRGVLRKMKKKLDGWHEFSQGWQIGTLGTGFEPREISNIGLK